MGPILKIVCILAIIAFFLLFLSYATFYIVFYEPKRKKINKEEYIFPRGKIYDPYKELMTRWQKNAREMGYKEFYITSHDGLQLYGMYFEYESGAPMEIMFHGYRGCAMRDMAGGIERAFSVGRNVLLVEQRTSRESEGRVITFGIKEHRDVLSWVDFAVHHFGADVQIILTGISMGAATVMMAAGCDLPPQVVGVLADCGYTSPERIIKTVIRQCHLPVFLVYPLVKLSARLWGHFDLEEYSPLEAMKTCKLPILFAHGEADNLVPCSMSRENYDACTAPKYLLTVPGAGHGLAYGVEPDRYLEVVADFYTKSGIPTSVIKKRPPNS